MCRGLTCLSLVLVFCLSATSMAQPTDVTSPGDPIFDYPRGSSQTTVNFPSRAIDNIVENKFFSYSGDTERTGLDVTPSIGRTVVTGLRIATANDSPVRDPVKFELWGANTSIDGPYTFIAAGDIVDFSQTAAWPRNSWGTTPITFKNNKGYLHYRLILFPIRDASASDGNGLQIGEFELLGVLGSGTEASSPIPAMGAADVPRDTVMSWTPGGLAATHDVYLGTVFADVNTASRASQKNVLVSRGQDANTYDPPGSLLLGQTYYWRIDEVNAAPDTTIFKGEVWSFTTEPVGYPVKPVAATASSVQGADTGPEKTIDGSGLTGDGHSIDTKTMWLTKAGAPGPAWIRYDFDKLYKLHQMLVWNYNGPSILAGFGLQDVTIEYSQDGDTWTVLPDAGKFEQAPGADGYEHNTTIDLKGIAAKAVRITARSNWGGAMYNQYGLSEVRFFYIPVAAREPKPAGGATGVTPPVVLSWRAGREAASHEVYFGADAGSLALAGTVSQPSYETSVDLARSYAWKIVEVNQAETPSSWAGDVLTFSTAEYLAVDDFESYTNNPPKRVFQTWVDGLGFSADDFFPKGNAGNGSGATVGYDPQQGNITETVIVHGGRQSMPLSYDNTGVANAEAVRTFAPARDWTQFGIKTLVLWFYGAPGNTGQLYVKVNSAKVTYSGNAVDITRPIWTQWNIDLASLSTNLQNVTTLAIGIDGSNASGTLFLDDIRLYRAAPSAPKEQIWIEAEATTTISAPLEVFSDQPDASGGKYMGSVDKGLARTSSAGPGTDGTGLATYTFTVQGGVYTIQAREIVPSTSSDSWWVRVKGATLNTKIHASGWIQWNNAPVGKAWRWNYIYSTDDGGKTVLFTLPAGTYTLEMAYREDGCAVDAFVIMDKPN